MTEPLHCVKMNFDPAKLLHRNNILCTANQAVGPEAILQGADAGMPEIARSDDVRRQNQRRIFDVLRRSGPMSRKNVSARTGLSASTVTAITARLLERGVLAEPEERTAAVSKRGRPQVRLALHPAVASVGVVSLSLNRISAALVDYCGNVIVEKAVRIATRELREDELKSAMVDALAHALGQAAPGAGPIRHIAVAVQGVTDTATNLLLWSPITPHRDVDFISELERAFAAPVTVANDCSMIAEALRWREDHVPLDSYAAILLSHGIGMGLILKGQLFSGIGSSAAEFGHMTHIPGGALCRCGRHGCIEAYAGDYAIWRAASGLDLDSPPFDGVSPGDMVQLAHAAKDRDGPERRAYQAAGEAIGNGLGSLFALFDPFPVAFAGSGVLAFDLMEGPIRRAIGDSSFGISHAGVKFSHYLDEFPLARDGCAMRALVHLDAHMVTDADKIAAGATLEGAVHAI